MNVEGLYDSSLKRLIEHGLCLEAEDVENVLSFICTQWVRTERAFELFSSRYEDIIDLAFSGPRKEASGAEDYRINGREDVAKAIMLKVAIELIPCLKHLTPAIIHSGEHFSFLTSDAPLIHYNQYLEGAPTGSGLGCYGVQIFLPLTPSKLLFLYDPEIYKVSRDEEGRIFIRRQEDIDQINILQFLSSKSNVYFGTNMTPESLVALADRAAISRAERQPSLEEFALERMDGSLDPNLTIISSQYWKPEANLNLSFCHIRSKKKKLTSLERMKHKLRFSRKRLLRQPSLPGGFYKKVRRVP